MAAGLSARTHLTDEQCKEVQAGIISSRALISAIEMIPPPKYNAQQYELPKEKEEYHQYDNAKFYFVVGMGITMFSFIGVFILKLAGLI